MDVRTKRIGATLALIAMAFFAALPFWKWMYLKQVNRTIHDRASSLVEANPQLKLAWDVAQQDGVLTYPEAKLIVEAAGEKIEAE